MKTRLVDGLRVSDLGDEVVVLDPAGEQVHRVGGDGVAVLRLLAEGDGRPVDVPEDLRAGLDDLVESGVVETPAGWSRRKVLLAGGAVWTAATVSTFGLADPAAATSQCANMAVPTATPATYNASGTFTTGPAGSGMSAYNLSVHVWGGGGGGAGGSIDSTGGGGGGGEYRGGSISVNECATYTVTVGAGGAGGGNGPNHGQASSFDSLIQAGYGEGGIEPGAGGGTGGLGGSASTGGFNGTDVFGGGDGGDGGVPGTYQGGGGGGGAGGTTMAGGAGGDGGYETAGTAGSGGVTGGGSGGAGGSYWYSYPGWYHTVPAAGVAPGGGGGGGAQRTGGHTGGAGAAGRVQVD